LATIARLDRIGVVRRPAQDTAARGDPTTLASVPGSPETLLKRADRVADDDVALPSSRAFIAVTALSPMMHRYLPRSTAVTSVDSLLVG
jgi:hypothetical protein